MELSLLSQQFVYYTKQVVTYFWPKLGIGLLLASLAPHQLALHALAMIFVLDFVCGVWVAKKSHTLSSFGMRRGIAKLFIYFIFIGTVALAEHSVLNTNICTMTAIGILSATEVLSIVENLVLLGLPIPYASKILAMVGNKASYYGIKLDLDDPSSMASSRDIVSMIEVTIPEISDERRRICVLAFATNWYSFMRSMDTPMFTGSHDLMWERLKHAMDRTLVEIRSALTKESIPLSVQNEFLELYAGELLKAFRATCKATCDVDGEPLKKIANVRDALCLMLYRLVQLTKDPKVLEVKPIAPVV